MTLYEIFPQVNSFFSYPKMSDIFADSLSMELSKQDELCLRERNDQRHTLSLSTQYGHSRKILAKTNSYLLKTKKFQKRTCALTTLVE